MTESKYDIADLLWFDECYETGISLETIAQGMRARGHKLDGKGAGHLADRRNLRRPDGHPGRYRTPTFEELVQRALAVPQPKILPDNVVRKTNKRYRYEGGFSMIRGSVVQGMRRPS